MKLAFVTETYPPEINGVALTVQSLVRQCRKLGHHVELTRPSQPNQPKHASERLVVERLVAGATLPFYRALRFGYPAKASFIQQWQTQRPDGVYVATEGPLGWSAVGAARALGIPVVTGLHTRFDDFMAHYRIGFLTKPAFAFMRWFHNRADATLVPTRSLQSMLQSRGFSNVVRLERAVDTNMFSPLHRSAALRQHWQVDDHAPAVLFVGRIAPEKNLDLAVRSFAEIAKQFPNARMIWVGDGPARQELTQRLQADSRHQFCGMLTGAALTQAYASADIFLFPSLSETFGNVTLEALASGLPVCAFNYGAAEEVIHDPLCGRAVRFGEQEQFIQASVALARQIHADPERCRVAARLAVAELDPAAVAQSLVCILRELSARATRKSLPLSRTPESQHS